MDHVRFLTAGMLFLALLGCLATPAAAQTSNDTLARIEQAAASGQALDAAQKAEMVKMIEADPKGLAPLLIQKLKPKPADDNLTNAYVWALGWTHQAAGVDPLINVYSSKTSSDPVKLNCLEALAHIGGKRAGDFLVLQLKSKTEPMDRFPILSLLAEMQYEPALAKTEDVLKLDFQKYFWQSVFIFGKMGDKAVPFLINKINDPDVNVRTQAVIILGQWLIAPEANHALQDRFWREPDEALQIGLLSAIENTLYDLNQWKAFFAQVKTKAPRKSASDFATESLNNTERIKARVNQFLGNKKVSKEDFDREYAKLYASSGSEGDYKALGLASTLQDEAALKKLRERILQRPTQDSFTDFKKVDSIITLNRLAEGIKETK